MKHLTSFNENNKFLKLKETFDTLKNICLEAQDDGFTFVAKPDNDIKLKMLSMDSEEGKSLVKKYELSLNITFTKLNRWDVPQNFQMFELKDVVTRVKTFMDMEGWNSKVMYISETFKNGFMWQKDDTDDNSGMYIEAVSIKFERK